MTVDLHYVEPTVFAPVRVKNPDGSIEYELVLQTHDESPEQVIQRYNLYNLATFGPNSETYELITPQEYYYYRA